MREGEPLRSKGRKTRRKDTIRGGEGDKVDARYCKGQPCLIRRKSSLGRGIPCLSARVKRGAKGKNRELSVSILIRVFLIKGKK